MSKILQRQIILQDKSNGLQNIISSILIVKLGTPKLGGFILNVSHQNSAYFTLAFTQYSLNLQP